MDKKSKLLPALLIAACILLILVISLIPADGWSVRSGRNVYFLDGHRVTGWQQIEGQQYYFDPDGYLCTGWQEIDGNRYYFDDSGIMVTGWLLDAHYFHPDGRLATGWLELDGKRYYLGDDGRRKAGIVDVDGEQYLLNEQGYVHCGWAEVFGSRYYGDEQGHPLFGRQEIDGVQYHFDESGAALTGWQKIDGFTYYFYSDGAAARGRLTIDGTVCNFASNGQFLHLVNPWNYVPEDYTVDLVGIGDTHQVASIAYEDFLDMMTDCRNAGFEPMVCSSYRTQEYQEELFQKRIDRYVKEGLTVEKATELAGYSVAIPGTSEHQLGLALDIVDNDNWHLDETQAEMPTQQWLMENSWRYGWILRYPVDKSAYTGIIYEPWHYRYVGRTVAAEIQSSGLCLEEYLEMLTDSVG